MSLLYRSFTSIMTITNLIRFNNLWSDIFGSVPAAVVALPLTSAFGVAAHDRQPSL
jgi:MFS superfamily sulfate permease-like transporter